METARAADAPVFHGNASWPDTLVAAGLAQARLVVLTFSRPQPALRIAQAFHERRPTLPVVVSCARATDARALSALPNVRIYQQSSAAALGLAEQVMSLLGLPADAVSGKLSEGFAISTTPILQRITPHEINTPQPISSAS